MDRLEHMGTRRLVALAFIGAVLSVTILFGAAGWLIPRPLAQGSMGVPVGGIWAGLAGCFRSSR